MANSWRSTRRLLFANTRIDSSELRAEPARKNGRDEGGNGCTNDLACRDFKGWAIWARTVALVLLICLVANGKLKAAIVGPLVRINQDVRAQVNGVIDTAITTTGLVPAERGVLYSPGTIEAKVEDSNGNSSSVALNSSAVFGPTSAFRIEGSMETTRGPGQFPFLSRHINTATHSGHFGSTADDESQFVYRFELDAPTRLSATASGYFLGTGSFGIELRFRVNNNVLLWGEMAANGTGTGGLLVPRNGSDLTGSVHLAAGVHTLSVTDTWMASNAVANIGAFEVGVVFALGGGAEFDPILPDNDSSPWQFTNALSGLWFDPVLTDGYTFQMQSGSLFTNILALPSFLTSPVTVSANGAVVGQYGAGQRVDFTGLAGGGVSSFSITGITPQVDGDDPLAFPIQLAFNTPVADFSMTPIADSAAVPEPGSLFIWSVSGLLGLAALRRRRLASLEKLQAQHFGPSQTEP